MDGDPSQEDRIRLIGRLFFKLDEAGQNPASFHYFFWNHFWQNWFQISL